VARDRHDEFADALAAAFSAVQVGDPFDEATHMGPLAMERQRDRVERYIAKGVEQGATLVTGGGRPISTQSISPTTPSMDSMRPSSPPMPRERAK